MKLREAVTVALLGALIGTAYAFMQQADEKSAARDEAAWAGKADK